VWGSWGRKLSNGCQQAPLPCSSQQQCHDPVCMTCQVSKIMSCLSTFCSWSHMRAGYQLPTLQQTKCHSNTLLSCLQMPTHLPAQVSAAGVWGTPLEVASRAADIVTGLPTSQLLRRQYPSGYPASIHATMLQLTVHCGNLLLGKHVVSPHMSREQFLGRLGMGWESNTSDRLWQAPEDWVSLESASCCRYTSAWTWSITGQAVV
jgi:hypothetical protein